MAYDQLILFELESIKKKRSSKITKKKKKKKKKKRKKRCCSKRRKKMRKKKRKKRCWNVFERLPSSDFSLSLSWLMYVHLLTY